MEVVVVKTSTYSCDWHSLSASRVPQPDSDAYAEYVLEQGRRYPLNRSQLQQFESAITHGVVRSRPFLIDSHTSHAIEATLLCALHHSESFRAILAFSLAYHRDSLNDIRYENRYEVDERCFALDLDEVDYCEIYEASAEDCPLINIAEALEGHRDGLYRPIINVGAAPNIRSNYYSFWQEGLVHEVMHHVAGSQDPLSGGALRLGPTEGLARRIAHELDWSVPTALGYYDLERNRQIGQRNYAALIDLLNRHDNQEELMQRVTMIGGGEAASADFNEIEAPSLMDFELPSMPSFDDITQARFFSSQVESDSAVYQNTTLTFQSDQRNLKV